MKSHPVDITEISALLAARVEDVCLHLLPGGKRVSGDWVIGDATGAPGQSLKVNLTGEHAGKFRDWSAPDIRGDLIDLWQETRGLTRHDALREVKDWLGVRDPFADLTTKKKYDRPRDKATHLAISPEGRVMSYLVNERKLEPATINRFQVHADRGHGDDGGFICYPRLSPAGEKLNVQYIGLRRVPGEKKTVFSEKGCAPALFGWQALTEDDYKGGMIALAEGEIDAMSLSQWGIPALSISNGSGGSWIDFEFENLEVFHTIFIAFDADAAGVDNMQKTVRRLGIHRCRIVKLPRKDANACLQDGFTAEDARGWFAAAKWLECKDISNVDELCDAAIDEIYPSKAPEAYGWAPALLTRPDGGIEFLWGDVSIWSGVAGGGKSTVIGYLMTDALMAKQRVCIASFETKPAKSLARMICGYLGTPTPDVEMVRSVVEMLRERLIFVNRVGSMDPDELLDLMRFGSARYGIQHFVVDSLMRVNGLEEEYTKQGDFLNRLQDFSKANDAHVHLVCHPRKVEEGGIPGRQDVKGSNNLLNNCDNLIVVARNHEKAEIQAERPLTMDEKGLWDTIIVSRKQRQSGWQGGVKLSFCPESFRFSKYTPSAAVITAEREAREAKPKRGKKKGFQSWKR